MKLTKIEALKYCVEMWDILAHSRYRKKQVHREKITACQELVVKYNLYYPENECFMCEYVKQQNKMGKVGLDCNLCPMKDVWKTDIVYVDDFEESRLAKNCFCENSYDSPYRDWMEEWEKPALRRFAKAIADGAREMLQREEENA